MPSWSTGHFFTMSPKGEFIASSTGAVLQVSGQIPWRISSLEQFKRKKQLLPISFPFPLSRRPTLLTVEVLNFWKADIRPCDMDSPWSWEVKGDPKG